MWTAANLDALRQQRKALIGRVGLVPTMGALHDGHLSLIKATRETAHADHVIVTIFVNPTQFGPGEDFDAYPRRLERDLALCEAAGAQGVFCPSPQVMYPGGADAALTCDVNIPGLARILEGEQRPGHFAGVCRIVLKLLNAAQPDVACFGQKDYQQLLVIKAMAADLLHPTEIIGCPTLREPSGLAMSSRNEYLDDDQRRKAVGLFKALSEAKAMIEQLGHTDPEQVERLMWQTMVAHQLEPDYATLRHPHHLATLDCIEPALTDGVVALVAARIGKVRLLDNFIIGRSSHVI